MKSLTAIVLAVLWAMGWSAMAGAQAPRKVKMTIPVVAHSMTPVYLAQSRGFFADEKLELDITSTGGGGPHLRAVIAGDGGVCFSTGDNVILPPQEGKK